MLTSRDAIRDAGGRGEPGRRDAKGVPIRDPLRPAPVRRTAERQSP